ncbi:hypothetical protein QM583_13400 [Gordonia alkanivorans]|uniref:hypothetical protein n=1 Tax=Gordonia TaxID=2053 RepID=UPI0012BB2A78|nr:MULTISPECIES: hypothetical protein [Gordonia]MDJ0028080.1 hypothetical protein [Gordonia alkanivorans]QGP89881.1 hypothetical protein GKZ92_20920 [Gordonia sp. 135]
MSTGPDFSRGAQTLSTTMTSIGAAILVVCIGWLTVGWWQDGRWFWVAVGIAVIVVNIVLIGMQLRRRLSERVNDPRKPRRPLIDTFDDLEDEQ